MFNQINCVYDGVPPLRSCACAGPSPPTVASAASLPSSSRSSFAHGAGSPFRLTKKVFSASMSTSHLVGPSINRKLTSFSRTCLASQKASTLLCRVPLAASAFTSLVSMSRFLLFSPSHPALTLCFSSRRRISSFSESTILCRKLSTTRLEKIETSAS